MTMIDITYEDGLRLSELSGQLAGLKYEAANVQGQIDAILAKYEGML